MFDHMIDVPHKNLNITIVIAWNIYGTPGGAERILAELSDYLISKGHKVTVISADAQQGDISYAHDPRLILLHYGSESYSLKNRKPFLKLSCFGASSEEKRTLLTIKQKKAEVDQLQPLLQNLETDILLAFCPFSAYLAIKAFDNLYNTSSNIFRHQRSNRRPRVLTMCHSTPEFSVYGVIFNYIENKKLSNRLQFKRVRKQLQEYIQTAGRSDLVQVLMPNFLAEARTFFPKTQIIQIPNPVLQFKTASSLNKPLILNIARIIPLKRQILLVEAFSIIAKEFPEWKIEFWGSTQSSYTSKVFNRIQELGLQNQVFIRGTTQNIESVLNDASVLVITSQLEGFCLGMLEGMSKGLPVIGCRSCASVNSIIRDGENGLLCDDTPESLANALRRLLTNKELRSSLGQQAKKDASLYKPITIYETWEKLLLLNSSVDRQNYK